MGEEKICLTHQTLQTDNQGMTTLPAKTAEKKTPKERTLTPRQRLFLKKYLQELGKGAYKSHALLTAHKAAKYNAKDDIGRIRSAHQIIEKIISSATFGDILIMAGTDDAKLAGKLSYLLDCKRPLVVKGKIVEYPDNYVQLKTTEAVMRHKGLLGTGGNVAVQINLSDRAAGLAVPMQPASIIDVETTDD